MKLTIKPLTSLSAHINLPPSKSYSIRALMIAACGGKSQIKGVSDCDDAKIASKIMKQILQKKVSASKKNQYPVQFFVGESGTTLRFLLPLLPFYCSSAWVQGKGTLMGRPNQHLCEALREQGLSIQGQGSQESIPIRYCGGSFQGGKVFVDGSISSQFISALMIALPLTQKHCFQRLYYYDSADFSFSGYSGETKKQSGVFDGSSSEIPRA